MFNVWTTASRKADEVGLTITQVGCAGSFFLPGGGSLYLFVDLEDASSIEAKIESARAQSYRWNKEHGLPVDDEFFSYGLGGNDAVAIPMLVDLGNLERLETKRDGKVPRIECNSLN